MTARASEHQVFHEAGDSAAAVADAVLVLGRHLGKGTAVTLDGLENAVVAEATRAVALGKDNALDLSLEQVHLVTLQQGYSGAETSRAIADSIEFFQHFVNIGLAVMTWSGITCRVNSRLTIKGINFQSSVVAEAVITVMLLDIAGLHLGIFLDGMAGFGNILMASDVGQTQNFIGIAQHLTQLLQLVCIVGGKNNLLHLLNYELH